MFDVLAEPNRRRILELLLAAERSVGELVDELEVSQPTVSMHLKTLRAAGLVEVRVEANRRVYRLQPAPLRQLDDWLAPYRAAWEKRLDVLGTVLDDMDDDVGKEP